MSIPKSVLITGCSSGIGLCVAQGLAARGYRVFATARKMEDVARLTSMGLESFQLDVDDSISIARAVDEVLAASGGTLYALFNNAGFGQPGAVEDLSRQAMRGQFETNVFGPLELTRRVIPVMRQQGYGRIIQNSSLLGYVALPYRGAYNASKHALEGLTDTLRLELRGTNIFVSLVEPGPISSRFRANAFAKYQQFIDSANSAHAQNYQAIERRLTKAGPTAPYTLPPQAVLVKVLHALESAKPRARYRVTLPSHLFWWLRRALPTALLDRVLARVSRGETQA